MRRNIVTGVLSFILLASIASCSGSRHSKSKKLGGVWQIQPISVDGSNKDWPSPYPEYDSKANLGYAVSNDSKNLYITVETGDPATQLKILREGFTVWIDKTGGKDQVMAINYPLPNHNRSKKNTETEDRPTGGQWQHGNGGGIDKQRLALEDRVRKLLTEAKEYSLQGFKACNLQFPILERDTCGVITRMDLDADGELVWEAVIPFKSFYFKPEIDKRDNGKPMSVCFETVGAKKPAGGQGNRGGNGGGFGPHVGIGGMGMGMRMGGGGMRGGNSGQGNNMMESLYKSTTTWKTFGIAYEEKK